ncbi:MAG: MBL fold metallo-hydrolase [Armatimonadota bacterium]|nr:MBL fold metallo-hydrolase [Armatimonadota bacterium]MDR7457804.1 MBL fold metallo-hydrolase [Armatimonadota bacterium]MDR7496538.1 MBL fold metallo-hydrolase [Armatimonadota bacterium]
MRLIFHGAVRTVTGSLHIVEAGGALVYLDCGLFQGAREAALAWNRRLPTPARDVDAVILSHAHLDHCGNLPTLVAGGFRGPIYCTPATRDLTALVLRDAAKVARHDVAIVNRLRRRQGLPAAEPLYGVRDVERTLARLCAVPYGRTFRVGPGAARFVDAGHILGSASVVFEAGGRRLGFTGDLGRPGTAIIRDPDVLPAVDLLVTESTYGDRDHESREHAIDRLASVVGETVARGGRVLIPAFAVGRTQELAYALRALREAGRVPEVPVYVDSPMATDATAIFRRHPEGFGGEARTVLRRRDPFGFRGLRYVRTARESRALVARDEPCVVIATSGMAESGRILAHLERYVGDPRSTLLFVGYQAEHTLGRRLLDGAPEVRIYGEPHHVAIRIARVDAFSAHADRRELLAWIRRIPEVGRAFCVHGDEEPARALARALTGARIPAAVPVVGQGEAV